VEAPSALKKREPTRGDGLEVLDEEFEPMGRRGRR